MRFYETCTEDEQLFLSWLFSGTPDSDEDDAAEVEGFVVNPMRGMQETQMSFNLQYLQLQSQMQHENRSYTAISNIMKAKHDTVKNSISNIR